MSQTYVLKILFLENTSPKLSGYVTTLSDTARSNRQSRLWCNISDKEHRVQKVIWLPGSWCPIVQVFRVRLFYGVWVFGSRWQFLTELSPTEMGDISSSAYLRQVNWEPRRALHAMRMIIAGWAVGISIREGEEKQAIWSVSRGTVLRLAISSTYYYR